MKLHFSIRALVLSLLSVGATTYAADVTYENGGSTDITTNQTWYGNATEKVSVSGNSISSARNAYIGAINLLGGVTLSIEGYGNVLFDSNAATGYRAGGAALNASASDFLFRGNGNITFRGNEAIAKRTEYVPGIAYGGAIFGKNSENTHLLSGNSTLIFSGNKALSEDTQGRAAGGAIYMENNALDISANTTEVSFTDNIVKAEKQAEGGAINCMGESSLLTLNLNNQLKFECNQAISTNQKACGGAISCDADTTIAGNTAEVIFVGNAAVLQTAPTAQNSTGCYGGAIAIEAEGKLQITGNTDVKFKDNYISAQFKPSADNISKGGAIYASGLLEIQGNDTVHFSGNYEHKDNSYTMNAVYAEKDVVISANKDGKVEFYDGVIVLGNADLNSSYEGKEQTGEILFSGADVETNLQAVKTAAGAGDVTAEEIERSRRFSVAGAVVLHAGTLKLDEAVLAADSFTVKSGAAIKLNFIDAQRESLSLTGDCIFEKDSNVILQLTEKNIGSLTSKSNAVSFLIADVEATTAQASISTVGDLGIQWEYSAADFDWKADNGKTWITGSVNAVTNIVVDDAMDLSESITDVADGTKRSVTVVNTSATLSGDNTHTGGTAIVNADVTLGSATALGAGAVSSTGISSLTVADGVVAVLPGVIANKDGELTLNGAFDASALKSEVIGATYLGKYQDEELEPGANGFYRHEGSSILIVENNNASIAESSAPTIIGKNGEVYTFDTSTGMAVAHGKTLWDTYHINTGDHTAKVSEIIDASKNEQGVARLQLIEMTTGTLGVDQSVSVKAQATTNPEGEITDKPTINLSGEDTELSGTITDSTVNASGGKLAAALSGHTDLTVTGTVEISGDNSHEGSTIIAGENAKLTVGSAKALGNSTVELQEHGTLDLNHLAVDNAIEVTGCTLANAENYNGRMGVAGNLNLVGPTAAAYVSLRDKGSIAGESLHTTVLEANRDFGTTKYSEHTITGNVTINDNGFIILYSGKQITLNGGSLTLGNNVKMVLIDDGSDFAVGDTLVTSLSGTITGDISALQFIIVNDEQEGYIAEITEDRKSIVLAEEDKPVVDPDEDEEDKPIVGPGEDEEDKPIVGPGEDEEDKPIVGPGEDEEDKPIVGPGEDEEDKPIVGPDAPAAPVFDQATADVLAQSNWGIFTASHAFVDAVQGQRNNMGCIAGGRGTAWASLLGGMTDISGSGVASGSDITLFGAAVGVDMKLGKRSSLGVAFGYTDGEVSADGLGDIDQETGHIALYGEHGLKKFAADSCLSLDWVAAIGTTESKYMGTKWEQDSVQLNARLSWNKQVTERFSYNVFGGLEYFASESDRVQNCKSGSVQNLRGELGIGVRYVAQGTSRSIVDEKGGMVNTVPGCERVVLYGEVSYINDMVRNNPSIEVNGLRGSGANPGRQGAGVEAGATIRLGERWSANANYSFNAMDDSNEHILNIGASRTF